MSVMPENYYHRRHLPAFSSIGEGQAELAQLFFSYYGAVFQPGALSVREKSLAALAVAHVVQCPYCIDAYTSGSLEIGADLEQLTEAIHIAAATRAHSTLAYGQQTLEQARYLELSADKKPTDSYFSRDHAAPKLPSPEASTELYQAESAWENMTRQEGALNERCKSAIALACAHALQCPYSIDQAVGYAQQQDLDLTAMTEAIHVATAIRGGASLVHGVQMLEQIKSR